MRMTDTEIERFDAGHLVVRAPDQAAMRIAILGTRGIPANYGGFETFAEELSWRLVERGHQVTVYCRSHHTPRSMRRHRGAPALPR